jgi:hypothetical protein
MMVRTAHPTYRVNIACASWVKSATQSGLTRRMHRRMHRLVHHSAQSRTQQHTKIDSLNALVFIYFLNNVLSFGLFRS